MTDISKKVVAGKGLMVITVVGLPTGDEIIAALDEFYGRDLERNVLWDFRDADLSQITSAWIQRLTDEAMSYAPQRPGGKTAFVHTKDVSFGVNRMYEITAETRGYPIATCVFRDMDKALAWIEEGP